ncbi:ATP synthase subunit b, mitochondrial-like [Cydia splendana]|uniref:ATP synthase subunit b, mitochondrial-like n=1 Tax=Cydia splendana TaxID=1100963 RepID=UPI00300D6506
MLLRPVLGRTRFLFSPMLYSHTKTCPSAKSPSEPQQEVKRHPSGGGAEKEGGGSGRSGKPALRRNMYSGRVRLGFLPDEWFTFFYKQTGVTGPYLFFFNLTNYMVSKEIYVMEHEYYLGLSAFVVIFYATKKFGKGIGANLDKQVDAYAADLEKGRKMEMDYFNNAIKMAKDAQRRAEGQKLLMDAKKENVAMQLEAIYRERAMVVYRSVRGRMDYHIKRYQAEARIHQKWMLGWILREVHRSITPEFQERALQSAISDLAAAASRA